MLDWAPTSSPRQHTLPPTAWHPATCAPLDGRWRTYAYSADFLLSSWFMEAMRCSSDKGRLDAMPTGVHTKLCRKMYSICTSTIGSFCGGGLPRKDRGTLHASSDLLQRWETNAVRVRRLPLLGKCAAACVGLQGRLKAVGIPHPDSAGLILACGWIQHDPACRQ